MSQIRPETSVPRCRQGLTDLPGYQHQL